MIKKVKEGLRRYKRVLLRHERMYRRLVKKYDQEFGRGRWNLSDCSEIDRNEIDRIRICIRGMAMVLGLSRTEEVAIDEKCDIKHPR